MSKWTILGSALVAIVTAHNNGLALTPAMGYNTWNDFRCDHITADNIMKVADKMSALQLDKVGYEYINIDDCWAVSRDSDGRVIANSTAFPDGMKAVADYVHSKGFKFGIYTDRGNLTCAKRPGSWGFEQIDAQTYADWGVDYLKEDSCYAPDDHDQAFDMYATMRDALNKTGRPIYFSLCGWNNWYAPVGWTLGNSWRISGDVNNWDNAWNSVSINSQLGSYARPGGWNDPDMLVGSSPDAAVHMTQDQSRSQFTLWSVMSAPLLIGSNMLGLPDYDVETYTNAEVIAIDQDKLGVQGQPIWNNCDVPPLEELLQMAKSNKVNYIIPKCQQIWGKILVNNEYAVMFVNWDSTKNVTMTCDMHCLNSIGFSPNQFTARDLWEHKDYSNMANITVTLNANGGSRIFRLSKTQSKDNHFLGVSSCWMWVMVAAAVALVLVAVGVAVRAKRTKAKCCSKRVTTTMTQPMIAHF